MNGPVISVAPPGQFQMQRNKLIIISAVIGAIIVTGGVIIVAIYMNSKGTSASTSTVSSTSQRNLPSPLPHIPDSQKEKEEEEKRLKKEREEREKRELELESDEGEPDEPPKPVLDPIQVKKWTDKVSSLLPHLKSDSNLNKMTDSAEIKVIGSLTDDDLTNVEKFATMEAPQIVALKQLRSELQKIRTRMQTIMDECPPDYQLVNLDDLKFLQDHKDVVAGLEEFNPQHLDALLKSKPVPYANAPAMLQKLLILVDDLKDGRHVKDLDSLKNSLEEASKLHWLVQQNFKMDSPEVKSHSNMLKAPLIRTYILNELIYPEMLKSCQQFFMKNQVDKGNECATKLAIFNSLVDPLVDGEMIRKYYDKTDPKDLLVILPPADKNEYSERIKILTDRIEQYIMGPVDQFKDSELKKLAQDFAEFNCKTCNGIISEVLPLFSAGAVIGSLLHDPNTPQRCSTLMNNLKTRFQDMITKCNAGELSKDILKLYMDHFHIMLGYRGLNVGGAFDYIRTMDDVDTNNFDFWSKVAIIRDKIYNPSIDNPQILDAMNSITIPLNQHNHPYFDIHLPVGSTSEMNLNEFMKIYLKDEFYRQCDRLVDIYGNFQTEHLLGFQFGDLFYELNGIKNQRGVTYSTKEIPDNCDSDNLMKALSENYPSLNKQFRELIKPLRINVDCDIMDFSKDNISGDKAEIDSKVTKLIDFFNLHFPVLHHTARQLMHSLFEYAINPDDNLIRNYIILKSILMTSSMDELENLLKYLNFFKELTPIVQDLNLGTFTEQSKADIAYAKAISISEEMRVLEATVHQRLHHLRLPIPTMSPRVDFNPVKPDEWYFEDDVRERLRPIMRQDQGINPFDKSMYWIIFRQWRTNQKDFCQTQNQKFQFALWSVFSDSPFFLSVAITEPNDPMARPDYSYEENKEESELSIPTWSLTYLTDHRHLLYWENDPVHMMIWTLRAQKALYTYKNSKDQCYRELFIRYRQFQQKAHNPTGSPKDKPPKRDHLDVLLYQMLFTPLVTEAIDDINLKKPKKPELLFLFFNCSAFPQRLHISEGIYPGPPAAVLINLSQRLQKAIEEYYYLKDFPNRDEWLKFWKQQILFGFAAQAMLPLVELWIFDNKDIIQSDQRLYDNLLTYAFQNRSTLLFDQLQKWCPGNISDVKRPYNVCTPDEPNSPFCTQYTIHHVRLDAEGLAVVEQLKDDGNEKGLLAAFNRSVQCLFQATWNWRWMRIESKFDYFRFSQKEDTIDASGVSNAAKGFVGRALSRVPALMISCDGRRCISNIASADALQMWIYYLVWTAYKQPGSERFFEKGPAESLFSPDPKAYKTSLDAPIEPIEDDGKDPLNAMVYDFFFDYEARLTEGRDMYTRNYIQALKGKDILSNFPAWAYQLYEVAPNGFKRRLMESSMENYLIEDLLIKHWGMEIEGDDQFEQIIPAWFTKDYVYPQMNTHMRYGILKARYVFMEMLHRVTVYGHSFLNSTTDIIERFKEAPYELEDFLAEVDYSDASCSTGHMQETVKEDKTKTSVYGVNFLTIANPDGETGIRKLFEYFVYNDLVPADCKGKGLDKNKLEGDPKERECRNKRQEGINAILAFACGNIIRNRTIPEGATHPTSIKLQCIDGRKPTAKHRVYNTASTCYRTLKIKQAVTYDEFKQIMLDTLQVSEENVGAYGTT